jgi:hypothetical protein
MRRILLARHGETEWNVLGKLQGHTDIPLNDTGRAQARSLAATVADAGIAAVLTSDLARARQTGEIVATTLGLGAPVIDPNVRERRFGVFEGLTAGECATHHPDAWQADAQKGTPPGGEARELRSRDGNALARSQPMVAVPPPARRRDAAVAQARPRHHRARSRTARLTVEHVERRTTTGRDLDRQAARRRGGAHPAACARRSGCANTPCSRRFA